MKKIILGSVAILLFILILIFIITNALRIKPGQQVNPSSFPTVNPHTVSPLKNNSNTSSLTSSKNQQSSSKVSTNNNQQVVQSSAQISPTQQTGSNLFTPSNSNLISQKDKENITYLKNFTPYDTIDFSIEYSSILNKYIVTTKGAEGEKVFTQWANENGLLETLQNKNIAIISSATMAEIYATLPPELQPTQDPQEETRKSQAKIGSLFNFFSTFFSVPESMYNAMNYQLPTLTPTPPIPTQRPLGAPIPTLPGFPTPTTSTTPPTGRGYVYYPQCGGPYDNYPLTPTITVCKCGCGPTTVSMILSSYLGRTITPPEVVDIYKSQGRARCGTSLGSAKKILAEQGVTTSDYIVPYNENGYKIEQVADDMKPYIRNGWTIFVLASFASSSDLNHFFWITNIDDQNNVYAYDPYYGSGKIPPINQNTRYPYPKYLAAFGVRK